MIDISNVTTCFDSPATMEAIIRGMRNPMNSWALSDSGICKGGDDGIGCDNCSVSDRCFHTFCNEFVIGNKDYSLMEKLSKAGTSHSKYRRMMTVYVDILAPLYWWKEFDTYKIATVANSCSTMHKIHEKEFTLEDFSHEHLLSAVDGTDEYYSPWFFMGMICGVLNRYRTLYLETKDKRYWWQLIQLLPSSYNQKRTVMLNYEVLANIYHDRKNHKLDEWREFCEWIRDYLPYSKLITMEE